MSRCECCNKKLNEYEMTLRHLHTDEFLNTCMKCLDGLGIPMKGRDDLKKSKWEQLSFEFGEDDGKE